MRLTTFLCRWTAAGLLGLGAACPVRAQPPGPEMLPPPAVVTEKSPGTPGVLDRPLDGEGGGPRVLDRPLVPSPPPPEPLPLADTPPYYLAPVDPPLGFAGPSGILPREFQQSSHFVPMEDRWRVGFPEWDRHGPQPPPDADTPYEQGRWYDPYNLNVIKGDYPILGQHTFFALTANSLSFTEFRQVPVATTPFESTARPFQEEFFGRPNQFFTTHFFSLRFDLFHGDTAAFKPVDWRVQVQPVFNVNYLAVEELAVVSPDVTEGTTRGRTWLALQEWFAEAKLADSSPYYDFISARVGTQPFLSDFRGFLFDDVNRGIRLFGTRLSNRDQFNLVYFRQLDKDTNSTLNTFEERHQDVVIANYYRQDFIYPGYTAQWSLHYNHDAPTFKFDKNKFLVRPAPIGVAQPHELHVVYLGWAGDGHIGRYNITHQFYWALGTDSLNPLANQPQDINAQFFAIELSYDRDWARFRTSFLYSSGDDCTSNSHATAFDTILDNPNFAGGLFSYWQRQSIRLFGVNLTNAGSLIPDLRSSKIQGQAQFVNPGLFLYNVGVDFELTPRLKMINNANLLWFDEVEPLQTFLFQRHIDRSIGLDLSTGLEYRPLLTNNIIMTLGLASLVPGAGFRNIYDRVVGDLDSLLFAAFAEVNLTF